MKRRTLKQQIPQAVEKLSAPINKYLAASTRVSQDTIYSYQRIIEVAIFNLMRIYLTLDRSWPHRQRWLDGLNEDFSWHRKHGMLYGNGQLFWGHLPEVGQAITGMRFSATLVLCPRHGIEYRLECKDVDIVRRFTSRRWCRLQATNEQLQ